jgi:hypothetical protein
LRYIYHLCTSLPTYPIRDIPPVLVTTISGLCASSYMHYVFSCWMSRSRVHVVDTNVVCAHTDVGMRGIRRTYAAAIVPELALSIGPFRLFIILLTKRYEAPMMCLCACAPVSPPPSFEKWWCETY